MNVNYQIENEPDAPEAHKAVLEGIRAYNTAHAATPFEREVLKLFARNPQREVIGGVFASVTFHWLHIEILWVSESARGTGLGAALIQDVESRAVSTGAHSAVVETTSFQARPFYEKMGYEVFASLPDYPIGDTTFYMKKILREIK